MATYSSMRQGSGVVEEITGWLRRGGEILGGAMPDLGSLFSMGDSKQQCDCCPPVKSCPPYCIAQIHRHAYPGERIVVPFRLLNTSSTPKRYAIGVRPITDENGTPMPTQPTLDKTVVTLQPRQSVLVEMRLDLTVRYTSGNVYDTEIVVRERERNQNICFRLVVDGFVDVPVAAPQDEDCMNTRFVGWRDHYYCDPKTRVQPDTPGTVIRPVQGDVAVVDVATQASPRGKAKG